MAPIPRTSLPRLILYHQTVNDPSGNPISILPLITQPDISVTHLIVAAIHINSDPSGLTLNDHPPSDPRFATLWAELRIAQASGISVLGMLGGAAKGSFTRLDQDENTFEVYYTPLRDMVRDRGLDGLDLDVEEPMSLAGIIRLIDRLRADFGPSFLITLAPVAAALLDSRRNLSGFDYEALEVMRGKDIAWYNAQFYCGWGDASTPFMYDMCVARGWDPRKVVMGLVTTSDNGSGMRLPSFLIALISHFLCCLAKLLGTTFFVRPLRVVLTSICGIGWVPWEVLGPNLVLLRKRLGNERFGGVMGWEYFNSSPGGKERPWEWAQRMTKLLRNGGGKSLDLLRDINVEGAKQETAFSKESTATSSSVFEVDPDTEADAEAPLPDDFQYYSDGPLQS
ncbi:putative Glycoside hydrolase superfamily [Seiridium cardinale]|uniref:Glycoside hydrolase superfamily n=1 Tax=Seiridium cardinale TaxID=138064 RepID=A0ABR2XVZ1_9PEZI